MTDPDPRSEAIARLGRAGRALGEAVVRTEVDEEELERAATELESITARLSARSRGVGHVAMTEHFDGLVRVFSPADGPGHPAAFPISWERLDDGSVRGTAPLGARFEGPPGLLHGGAIALLFDQVLGNAVALGGVRALTASLAVRFLRPVPLDDVAVLTARVDRVEGRKRWAVAELAPASAPGTVAARAEALFIVPAAGRTVDLFAGLQHSDGSPADFGPRG